MRCPKHLRRGSIFASTAPAHIACSSGEVRNSPRCPDVPDDKPTEILPTVGLKSRVRSASRATFMAWSLLMPTVFKSSKRAIIRALSILMSSKLPPFCR